MRNRILSGPHPAVKNLEYEWDAVQERFIVTGGEPTWSARSLDDVQSKIDDWGLSSYLREAQHEVEHTGGIWDHIEWVHTTFDNLPPFKEVCVAVDPAVTSTDESDSQGISIGGKTMNHRLIGLYFWEGIDTPEGALERAIYEGYRYGARFCLVETNQGGDTWESVYANACKKVLERLTKEWHAVNPGVDIRKLPAFILPRFKGDKAGAGDGPKIERNQQLLPLYETGMVQHMLGTHKMIEKALRRFPVKPLDLADSWWWCAKELDMIGTRTVKAFGVRS
jgi:phage terminase large subunit-like protein